MLSYPPTTYIIEGVRGPITFRTEMGLIPFLVTIFVLGFFMSLGKAAVFKHIPVYYPNHVGAVGGLVGMIGGLGGFVLPLAFGALLDLTGVWTSCFVLLFVLVGVALDLDALRSPADGALGRATRRARTGSRTARNAGLWRSRASPCHRVVPGRSSTGVRRMTRSGKAAGRAVARRNLWVSTYCLMLSFAVWMVWSVVVARLPAIGFDFTTDQLFWLAALPGLSGATLRIFYAFLVPIFGGRLWTTLSTASLLIPAFGIGYAVQSPDTPYLIFLVLALLCGLGRRKLRLLDGQHQLFFPKDGEGQCAGAQCRAWQSWRQPDAVPRPGGRDHEPVRSAWRTGPGRRRRHPDTGCRTPASSGCR